MGVSNQRFPSEGVRVRLGSWVCPSGNSLNVYLTLDESGKYDLWLYWDQPPPLLPEDRAYYLAVVRPEVIRRFQERTGLDGHIFVVTIE